MEAERHRQLLLLDSGDVEIRGGRDPAFGQFDAVIDRRHRAAAEDLAGSEFGRVDRRCEFFEERLAIGAQPEQQVRHENRDEPRESLSEIGVHLFKVAITLPEGVRGFDQRRAELLAEDRLDLGRSGRSDRLGSLVAGADQHRLADDPDAYAPERLRWFCAACIGPRQHRGARHRRIRVARVVIARFGVLQRVEDFGGVGDRAHENSAAVAIDVGADRAAVEAQHCLVRQDQRDRVVVGRSARRSPGLLAEAHHDEVGADRHARPGARTQ